VRAIQFDLADPEHPASLVEVDEPALPRGDWARVAVTGCGICGSDLHLFSDNMGHAPALGASMASHSFPFVLGHELAGVVVEAGPDCRVAVGTRVAVLPDINCEARGIDPPCRPCANGWASGCHNAGSGVLTPGSALGFTSGLGGGWAEQAVAHESMLFPLPDSVGDDAAPLHEPVSIAVHGLLRAPPADGDPVLVIGAAAIGLATVAALKARGLAVELLSGDRPETVAAAARAVGIDIAAAARTPAQKIERLEALRAQGRRVLMVGDGLNDAPALAAAHASLSPVTAADISQATADIVFQGDALSPVIETILVARETQRMALQNFAIALGYNAVFVPLAVVGLVTPLVAAIAMSASSVAVTANAIRLKAKRLQLPPRRTSS